MESKHIKNQVISSLLWKIMERGGTQGIQFIVQIVLARLLAPEQFGTIAIVSVFISLANVFIQSGFNTALIQKKDSDVIDFSSVFYFSLSVASLLYLMIYFFSPLISNFYGDSKLIPILRVLSITLFFGAFNSIQNAYIAKNMMFKKLFISSSGSIVISGVVGIIAAYQGLGVWALVIQQLVNQVSITIILLFIVKWRPKLIFSIERMKGLFLFGWKLLASSLLNVLYMDLRTLIIGKVYAPSMLGYYNRGEQFPKLIVKNIDGSIQSVMLPTLSLYQDQRKQMKMVVRRSIMTSSFLVFPMMIGIAVIAEPLIRIVLTDKWLPAVPFLQIFCVSYSLMPIHTANLQAINAMGRSDIFLKLEIIKKTIGLTILVISIPFGIYAIAIGMALNGIISSFVNAYPNKKLLNYSYQEQLKDIIPSLTMSMLMGVIVYIIGYIELSIPILLFVQVTFGIMVYLGLSKFFKIESYSYLMSTIKQFYNRTRNK